MSKTIKTLTVTMLDFDDLSRASNDVIISRFLHHYRNSKKALYPKSVIFDACEIKRGANIVVLNLLSQGIVVGVYQMVPPPDFSQRPIQI